MGKKNDQENERRCISAFAEREVRLARTALEEFAASPRMTLKASLLCIGEVRGHLDRAGVFHEMFNPFIGACAKGAGRNAKRLIEKTHCELAAGKEGK